MSGLRMKAAGSFALACVALAGCTERTARFCDNVSYFCDDPAFPYCDPVKGECESMPFDGYMPVDLSGLDHPHPDAADLAPMCMMSSQCSDTTPICGSSMCRGCTGPSDDTECMNHNALTPRCLSGGTCGACRTDTQATDCPSAKPVCGSNNICRTCQAHSECSSGVCKSDGSCAAASDVAYVNNASASCSDVLHASTPSMPYCQVQAAATLSGKAYVVVAGSSTAYNALNIAPVASPVGPLSIIGPGRGATPTAMIAPTITPAVLVNTSGSAATVVIDGFELIGAGGGSPQPGVKCVQNTGAATLTVLNSFVHGSGQAGVDSSGCMLTLDANIIGPSNLGGGVTIGGTSSYVITNNIIAGNGSISSSVGGVTFSNGASGTFAFNTVVRNTIGAGVGGIDCGTGGMKSILNSIAWRSTTSGGTQLGPQCMLTNVVTAAGDDTRGTMNAMPPTFVSATDFHLVAGDAANLACCIDKVATPGTPNSNHDVDNTTRPKGSGATPYDIGAHEVQ